MSKRIFRSVVIGFLVAIPIGIAFESQGNIIVKSLVFWVLLGMCFSGFIFYFSNKPYESTRRGLRYAKWTFLISLFAFFVPLFSIFTGSMAVGGTSGYELLHLLSSLLLYPILLIFPAFLIGYFRKTRNKPK